MCKIQNISIQFNGHANFGNIAAQTRAIEKQFASLNAEASAMSRGFRGVEAARQMDALRKRVGQVRGEFLATAQAGGRFNIETTQLVSSATAFNEALAKQRVRIKDVWRNMAVMKQAYRDQIALNNMMVAGWSKSATGKISADMIVPKDVGERLGTFRTRMGYAITVSKQLATQVVNMGKNIQWAGRQLTVGLTVPLAIAGGAMSKFAYDMDKGITKIIKVYDAAPNGIKKSNAEIRADAESTAEFLAKTYGQSFQDSLDIMQELAATGLQGQDLVQQTKDVSRAKLLGELDVQDALKTNITLQSAYNLSTKKLADTWNFFNSIENSTVLTMQDITEALPRVSGIMNTLGVSIQDTTTLLAAFKSSGIDAVEGAQALKSISFKIFNPSTKAKDSFKALTGIDYKQVIKEGKGELIPTFEAISKATKGLSNVELTKVIGNLAGIHQGSRFAGLIKSLGDISDKTTQVGRANEVAKQTTTDWAKTANGELKTLHDSVSNRLLRAWETMKVQAAQIGKSVLQIVTPLAEAAANVLKWFNNLGDGTKKAALIVTGIAALVGPATMLTGLFLNFAGTIAKSILAVGGLAAKFTVLEPKTKAARILADLAKKAIDGETTSTAKLTAAIEAQTTALRKNIETQRLSGGVFGSVVTGPTGSEQYRRTESGLMVPAGLDRTMDNVEKKSESVKKSWGGIGKSAQAFAMAASFGVGMFTSGTVANIANAAFMVSTIAPSLMKISRVQSTVGAIGGMFGRWGTSLGKVAGRVPKLTNLFKGFGKFITGPWGLAIGATLGGILLIHHRINSEIQKSAEAYENATHTAKGWADILGFTYKEIHSKRNDKTFGSDIQQQADAVEKMKERLPDLYHELQGMYNASDAQKWSRALEEGYKTMLAGGTEQQAKNATQTALRVMGESFSRKRFNVMIDAKIDFKSWEQNAERNINNLTRILNRAGTGRNDATDGPWETFGRFFSGQDEANSVDVKQINRMVDNFYEQFNSSMNRSQKRQMLINLSEKVSKPFIDAYNQAIEGGLIDPTTTIEQFLTDNKFKNVMRMLGISPRELDTYRTFMKIMREKGNIAPDSDIMVVRDIIAELNVWTPKAQKKWEDFQAALHKKGGLKASAGIEGQTQVIGKLGRGLEKQIANQRIVNTAMKAGIQPIQTSVDAIERGVENQKQMRVAAQNSADSQGKVADQAERTSKAVKMSKQYAQAFADVSRQAAEKTQSIAVDYFERQYQNKLESEDEARAAYEERQSAKLQNRYDKLNDELDARIDKQNDALDKREERITKSIDRKEERLNNAIDAAEEKSNARFDAKQDRMDARFDAQQEKIAARREKQDKAFESRWTGIEERLEKKQQARRDTISKSYDNRISKINKTIEAEKKAEDTRQRIFEAEKTRISRLATMFGQNVDFNQQIQSGNFDEAAKIANDMQAQQQQWGIDDTAQESQSGSDKLIARYEKEIEAINKSKDARLKQLDEIDDAEKKALDRRKEREQEEIEARRKTEDKKLEATRQAANKRLEAERKNAAKRFDVQRSTVSKMIESERNRAKKTLDIQREQIQKSAEKERNALENSLKRKQNALDKENRQYAKSLREQRAQQRTSLDAELALITAQLPRTKKERREQLREMNRLYADYGVKIRGKGRNLYQDLSKYLFTYTKAGVLSVRNDIKWDSVGKSIAKKLLKSGTNMTWGQFQRLIRNGELPKGWKAPMGPNHRTGGAGGSHSAAYRKLTDAFHHSGGIAGEPGKRTGYAKNAGPSHREVPATLLKGEGILSLKAMRNLGGKAFVKAANAGLLKKNVGGPDAGGLAQPLMTSMMAPMMGMIAKGLYELTSAKAQQVGSGMVNASISGGGTLSKSQLKNAQTILGVGKSMGATTRDLIISIMTAMQESTLRNLNYGDRDSLGLFQQRPSQGWGTAAQITNPRYAAGKFFQTLLGLGPARNNMSLTGAAQAVQRSAHPSLYGRWEGLARALVGATKFGGGDSGSWTDLISQIGQGGLGGTGGGHMNWRQMWAAVKQLGIPGVVMTSNLRRGAITHSGYTSYHSLGSAIDLVAPNMMKLFNTIRSRWGGIARELYYSPAGNRQVRNGHPYNTIGTPAYGDHFSHVHWAMRPPGSGNSTYAADALRNMRLHGVARLGDGEGDTSGPRFFRPVGGRVSSRFGLRDIGLGESHHDGIDIAAGNNTSVRAIAAGLVTSVKKMDGLVGNMTSIMHSNGLISQYMHQSRLGVRPGQQVGRGDVIGAVGNTGASTGPHLHLATIKNGKYVDPSNFVPGLAVGGKILNTGLAKLHPEEIVLTKPLSAKLESGIEKIDAGERVEYNVVLDMRGAHVSKDFDKRQLKRDVEWALQEIERERGPRRRIG